MIDKQKSKFVSYTVVLFAICFAIIFAIYIGYSEYSLRQDRLHELAWIAENNPEKHNNKDYSNKLNYDILQNSYNPIFCLSLGLDDKFEYINVIGGSKNEVLPDKLLDKIKKSDEDDWIIGQYVFYKLPKEQGNTLILITKVTSDKDIANIIVITFVYFIAVLFIYLISLYLSKLLVEPVNFALTREKQLTADISHELKNPIAAIKVSLSALYTEGVDSIYLNNAYEETNKLEKLVKELLSLFRAESLDENRKYELINLSDLVVKTSLIFESVAFEKCVTLSYEVAEQVFIKGEIKELENALSIILDNAIKYNKKNGFVKVRLVKIFGIAVIEIEDNGIGIPEKDLPYIFDRFFTSDKSRTGESFGLGLSIASAIIKRHGGSIEVKSKIDEGSIFTIKLNS